MAPISITRGAILAAALSLAFLRPAAAQSPGGNSLGGQFVAAFHDGAHFGFGFRLTASLTGRLGAETYLNFLPSSNSTLIEFALGPRFRLFSGHRLAVYLGILPGVLASSAGGSSFFFEPEETVEYRLPHRWLWRSSFGQMIAINQGQSSEMSQFTTGIAYRF